MLDNANNFSYMNYSAPEDNPLFDDNGKMHPDWMIKEKISTKIGCSQIVLVLSGMYGAYSNWMPFEIEEAKRMRKPIIGIVPYGGERTPSIIQNAATEMVRWNTDSIVSAIRELVS